MQHGYPRLLLFKSLLSRLCLLKCQLSYSKVWTPISVSSKTRELCLISGSQVCAANLETYPTRKAECQVHYVYFSSLLISTLVPSAWRQLHHLLCPVCSLCQENMSTSSSLPFIKDYLVWTNVLSFSSWILGWMAQFITVNFSVVGVFSKISLLW